MKMRFVLSFVGLFMALNSFAMAQDALLISKQMVDDRKAVLATVQTEDLSPARARIGGTVTELLVDEGSVVQAGEVIARVKDEKLDLEIQAVEARISSLQAERQLAQIALNRAQQLRKAGAGSQAKLDEARTNLDVVVKNLKAMETERELVSQREREGAVLSPTTGRVIRVEITSGEVILPGEPIAMIADKNYILRIEVPERHASFINVGDSVFVGQRGMSELDSDTLRKGVVRQVYPEMQKGRVVADVNVDNIGDYFIGERIKVFVSTGKRETILIPCNYVFVKYGLSFVHLKDGSDIVVQPGQQRADACEILSGLNDGDELLLTSAQE
ncbi:MAG: efflux RND transporter periplasmic adaptor subunit [Methylocystaceae bacterium]|nr:efflux RND transporter periplasmic adaptor subunit [Methylocystaceae bacterium]